MCYLYYKCFKYDGVYVEHTRILDKGMTLVVSCFWSPEYRNCVNNHTLLPNLYCIVCHLATNALDTYQ